MKRDLVSIADLSPKEIEEILKLARELKAKTKKGIEHELLKGKTLAMIFEKPSLRTRVTFETGMTQLGGHAIYLAPADIQLGKRESVPDVARNLSRWVDMVMARTFAHQTVALLAKYASIPVINALSDLEHPCQIMADFLTIIEHKGRLEGVNFGYLGDGNNVCNSLLIGAALTGMNINVGAPRGYEPPGGVVARAEEYAKGSGAAVRVFNSPAEAVKDVEVIYTDVWASMGQESETEARKRIFKDYQVNGSLLKKAKPGCLVMHCLPAHRGDEITDEVLDGPNSIVLDEAENRLHIQKAIMVWLAQKSR